MNDTTQIYDFNPGFGPKVSNVDSGNGFGTRVFWTAVIPNDDLRINPGTGRAELDVSNLPVISYYSPTGYAGNVSLGPNWQTAGVDASVSFHVDWDPPVTRQVHIKDAADGFAGTFNEVNNNNVTVQWSGQNASGFSFTSNVGNLTTSTALAPGNFFAQLGHERNGIFFPAASSTSPASVAAQGVPNSGPISLSTLAGAAQPPLVPAGTAGSPSLAPDPMAFDAVLLGRALASPSAVPAAAGPTLATLSVTDTLAPNQTGEILLIQPASAPHRPAVGTALLQATDQVFADLESSGIASAFHALDAPIGAV